jgi:hypothetical protein
VLGVGASNRSKRLLAAALVALLGGACLWAIVKLRAPSETVPREAAREVRAVHHEATTRPTQLRGDAPPRKRRENGAAAAVEPATAMATTQPGAVSFAAAVKDREFASPAEELAVWHERLPGEQLTLANWSRSLTDLKRVLDDGALPNAQRTMLTRRAAALEGKLIEQTARVARIESRVEELERPQGSSGERVRP